MAIVTNPATLVDTTDVIIDVSAKTISVVAGTNITDAGSTGGVTGQCLYSFLKTVWKSNSTYIKYPFPMEAITPEQFEFINDWKPLNDTTRKLLRTAGWAEKTTAGVVKRKYAGIVSLGSIGGTDQPYYQFGSNTSVNFTYTGPVNEAVQTYGNNSADATTTTFDYTDGDSFKIFCREQGKAFASSNNTAIGASTMGYIVYRFPLSNSTDLKITTVDSGISASSPYTGITITYYGSNQAISIGGTEYNFNVIIEGNNATTQQIYEKIQYQLRQTSDIDAGAGTVTGKTADDLLEFVGDTLKTKQGVYIQNLGSNYLNSIVYRDVTNTERTNPYIATGTISFGSNAVSDTDYIYRMFFTTLPGSKNYGTSTAVIVQNNSGADIAGTVSGNSSVSWTFAYDSNTQGGRTAGTDASVTVVGIGLSTGQFSSTTYTITKTTSQNISLSPTLERNYAS